MNRFGRGMPVLDALAHGVPVVASRRSAIPQVAGDAALLVELPTDEALVDDLVRRGRERVRQFSWESAVERTWAVYGELG